MATIIIFVVLLVCVVPFALIGIARATQTGTASQRIANLEANGATVKGEVTAFTIRPVRGGAICTARYRYEVEGKVYQNAQEVNKEHILAAGTHVQVRFLPYDPQIAMLTGQDRDDARYTRTNRLALFFLALVVVLLILLPIIVSLATTSTSSR